MTQQAETCPAVAVRLKSTLMALAACALAIGAVTAQAAKPAAKPTPTDLEAVFRKPPESAGVRAF